MMSRLGLYTLISQSQYLGMKGVGMYWASRPRLSAFIRHHLSISATLLVHTSSSSHYWSTQSPEYFQSLVARASTEPMYKCSLLSFTGIQLLGISPHSSGSYLDNATMCCFPLFTFLFTWPLILAPGIIFPNKLTACQPLPLSVLFFPFKGMIGRALTNLKLYLLLPGTSSPKLCGLSTEDLFLLEDREGNET